MESPSAGGQPRVVLGESDRADVLGRASALTNVYRMHPLIPGDW
ncbi:MAG: hypothetical protein ACR2NB_07705 [Solirubrobacteraceae bacterium]